MSALDKDKPIFSSTKRPLIYIKNGVVDDRESQMMAVRWNTIYIYFNYKISQHQQKNVATRPQCFTDLLSANTQAYAKEGDHISYAVAWHGLQSNLKHLAWIFILSKALFMFTSV